MAVIFMDSFQHYVTADISKKWGATGAIIVAASGRRGGNSLVIAGANTVPKTLTATYAGLIAGFAMKPGAAGGLIAFTDGATYQVSLHVAADGVLSVKRGSTYNGNGGTLLGSSAPGALAIAAWSYVEVSVVFSDTAGAVLVRVNGTTVINLTSVDTVNTANAYATGVALLPTDGGGGYYNDFCLIDPGTAPNTTFLGDVRIDAYYPTTDGASSQWTPTPSGAHYAVVDETAPNGTDEIEADVTGYIDLFGFQDLAVAPGAFYAVQVCAAAMKTDAGSRQIKSVVRSGVTNYPGTAKDVSETQKYILNQWNTDPGTAAAWTEAGFNAAEFGVELV